METKLLHPLTAPKMSTETQTQSFNSNHNSITLRYKNMAKNKKTILASTASKALYPMHTNLLVTFATYIYSFQLPTANSPIFFFRVECKLHYVAGFRT